jgi:FAD/FMN-containing dehydrogenase
MKSLTRRHVLKEAAAAALAAPAVLLTRGAWAQLPPLPNLPSSDALLLHPGDAQFAQYQTSFNERTQLTPQLRALCRNARAVGTMIDWCRSNKLGFALRCGGHSYEGFSQSTSVVIDTRLMSSVSVDTAAMTATVGAGASLGTLYRTIARHGFAFPGGSCPTVGVSGHMLGGGYGYLARPFGLACDNFLSVDLVNAQGQQVHADAQQNADLFWACRGGGGGTFGAAISYQLRLIKLANVFTFNIHLPGLSVTRAAAIMKEWQGWAPQAPHDIDSNFVIMQHPKATTIDLRCAGQTIGTSQELRRELKFLSSAVPVRRSFINAVNYFAGGAKAWNYSTELMKGKSDYAMAPMSDSGLETLMGEVSRRSNTYVVCDSYGGAIASTAPDATAFAHRNGTLYCLQYVTTWTDPKETPQQLDEMRQFYAGMRPYVSGAAYVNYCDVDLTDWQDAYWGANLPRLKQIKKAFDPGNVFNHAQSVPPA